MLPPLPPSPNTSTALPAQADADPGPATAAGPFETLIGRALLLGLATADAEPKAGTDEPSKSPPGASKKATSETPRPKS